MILVPPLCNQPHNPHDDNCKKHNNDSYDFLTPPQSTRPPFVLSRELIMMIDCRPPLSGWQGQAEPTTPQYSNGIDQVIIVIIVREFESMAAIMS